MSNNTAITKDKIPKRPWFYSTAFLWVLGLSILLLPVVPFLYYLRGPRSVKRLAVSIVQGLIVTLLFAYSFFVNSSTEETTTGGKIDGDNQIVDLAMPKLLGMNYSLALSKLEKICGTVDCIYTDLVDGRSVWDESNWTVVDQAPVAGAALNGVKAVCVGIVKHEEKNAPQNYAFPDNCPISESATSKADEESWIPTGFERFDERYEWADRFVWDSRYPKFIESCVHEGLSGRCAYYRISSRDGFSNGVFVVVQWLNSLNEIIEVSTFTTKGSVPAGGIFEFYAFLPSTTWDKPVSAKLVQIG